MASPGGQVLGFEHDAIGSEDKLGLSRRRLWAGLQAFERLLRITWRTNGGWWMLDCSSTLPTPSLLLESPLRSA